MIIFIWKISQELVKGCNVTFSNTGRRGRIIIPNTVVRSSPDTVRRAKEPSLGVKGAKAFNSLPAGPRNLKSVNVDIFKANFGAYLSTVSDQATIGDRTRAAATNSLLDQLPMMTAFH